MRIPDFLIIGAMKAATSSLHDQLAALPNVVMSSPKELYFFSDDPVYERGIDWYASHFAEAGPGDRCGESSTHYSKLPNHPAVVERIATHIPDARFVYVMRHPIDRLVSQFTHMWLEREVTVPFDQALAGATPELIEYSRYSMQLLPYFERFGAARVLPVFFDRLHAAPDEVLTRVAAHVGIEGPVTWNDDLAANNITSERLRTSAARDRIKQVPGYERLRRLTPESAIERVRRRWRPTERPEVDDEQRARLTALFDADLAVLGEWLGVELDVEGFETTTAARSLEWTTALLEQYPGPDAPPAGNDELSSQ